MRAWLTNQWTNLNERDRWTLGFGIALCCVYLFYYVLYSPLLTAVQTYSQQLLEKQETWVWMQQIRQEHPTQMVSKSVTSTQLLTILDDRLAKTSFKQFNYQLQQTGFGDIKLSYDRVPYTAFIDWLRALNQEYTFTTKQMTAESTETPGVVKIMVIFSMH